MSFISLRRVLIAGLVTGALGGCASPLFSDDEVAAPGTVPRDEMGEPIWSKIEPAKNGNKGPEFGASDGT